MTAYDLALCYCGCSFEDHQDGAAHCRWCDSCDGYAEKAEVLATAATLADEDMFDGERRRNNTADALHIVRRRTA